MKFIKSKSPRTEYSKWEIEKLSGIEYWQIYADLFVKNVGIVIVLYEYSWFPIKLAVFSDIFTIDSMEYLHQWGTPEKLLYSFYKLWKVLSSIKHVTSK